MIKNLNFDKYVNFRDEYGNLKPMSIKDWLITYLILCIPIANIVFAIIWAIGGENVHPDKQNYFRAYWIIYAIMLAISILISIICILLFVFLFASLF